MFVESTLSWMGECPDSLLCVTRLQANLQAVVTTITNYRDSMLRLPVPPLLHSASGSSLGEVH